VLDGILDNETELPIAEHTSDTAGYTDLVFSLFDLLGLQFSPRLRDLGDQKLYRIDPGIRYQHVGPLIRGILKIQLILATGTICCAWRDRSSWGGLPLRSSSPSYNPFGVRTC